MSFKLTICFDKSAAIYLLPEITDDTEVTKSLLILNTSIFDLKDVYVHNKSKRQSS